MKFCYTKVALLVLSLLTLTAFADHSHHSHEHNHSGDKASKDVLTAFDNHYHEYHHHHPVAQPNCGQVCPKSLGKFALFETGLIYTADLEAETLINVKEGLTVGLKGKVDVHVLGPCEFQLRLRGSQVTGVPNGQELGQQLDSSPGLRFGAHDGTVMGVCPAPEEAVWTLNVKKSILSALQVTTKDLSTTQTVEEVDFSGHCTTTYRPLTEIDADQKNVLIEKTKNLNKCHLRRKNISGFSSKSLTLLTEFLRENIPILKSTQRCQQEIKDGHLISVTCTEEQRLSFQDDSVVKSTINLRSAGKAPFGTLPAPGPVPATAQSLLMSRDDEGQKVTQEADVLSLLRDMCAQVSGANLAPEVTESFHTLVTALRTLPESGTQAIDKATKSGEICQSPKLRNLFIGASAFAASDASIQTIVAAYNSKELTETQITLLLSLVALKTRPSEKTIDSLVALIESKDSARPLLLGVSLMVKNFCKRTENCEQIPAVKKTVGALIQKLQTTDSNLVRITAIQALDNIGPKSDETFKSTLLALAQDSAADAGVRIAAIQALHCCADDAVRQKLIEILQKDSEPNEVRITAYRTALWSGATTPQLEAIRAVSDPQIQNYIRSHIKNVRKSSNPSQKTLLPADAPQFEDPKSTGLGVTRNLQYTYKGATIETDVIHPKGSFVPSLLTFGIWFPVGGKDYQLIQFQLRHQGLDGHVKKLIAKGISGPEILMQLSEEALELLAFLKDPNHKHTAILQLSVRMSGRNILFVDTFEDLHSVAVLLRDRLRELYKTEKIDTARAISLLDSQVEVPTINGFPMIVHLNETIVFAMKAEHSWVENAGAKTRTVKSARAYFDELSAGLNLKVRDYRPGFEYHLRFELTPTSDAQVERLENGRVVKAKINLPNERKTLFKLGQSTRLIEASGAIRESNEISGRANDEHTRCRQIFGLNVCRTCVSVDNSPVPNIEYYFTKEDPTLESLELILEKPGPTDTRELLVWKAQVNAGKREYKSQLEVSLPKEGPKKVNLKLVSPRRTITADGQLFNSPDGNVSKLEFDLKLPEVIDLNTKVNAERVGESRNIDILTEYKRVDNERQESIRWTRKTTLEYTKNKKSKQINVSYFGELKSTEFPYYNTKLSYYTNWRPYQSSKTDLTAEWGPELKDRVRIQHNSKMDVIELRPFQMVAENALTFEATPLDINYDFKLNSDISMLKTKPKSLNLELVGKDLSGRAPADIRGSLKYERLEQPIQQSVNASLSYPGRDYTYYSEVKEIKDLTYAGKIIFSPEKGKTVTIEHKESVSNPTKDIHLDSEASISYSWKPEVYAVKTAVGWETPDKLELKHSYTQNGKKHSEYDFEYDKRTQALSGQLSCGFHNRQVDFKVDNIYNPRTANWGYKSGEKSYKLSAVRVPKESVTVKLDSAENSRLKELKVKISKKEKSTLKLVTNEDLSIEGYIDPIAKDVKRAHLEVNCPKHQLKHTGDISFNRAERKVNWNANLLKAGQPWLTGEAQLTPKERTFIILKKIKGPDAEKFEYFYDKGVYAATLDTARWSAIVEGENRDHKRFGKIGFVDKVDNYEHKSHFNVSNGVLTIKSISDKEKQTFTKLDAVIGRKIISNISLITPNRNAQLIANPLGEKKTLVFNYVSDRYDQNTNLEWVPRKYLKVDSLTKRKVDPIKQLKVTGHLTRQDDSVVTIVAPDMDVEIKRLKTPKPHFVFNTTINGYNEVQEFDSNPSLPPLSNFFVALGKFLKSYTASG